MSKRSLYGVGINDVDLPTSTYKYNIVIKGKFYKQKQVWVCPYYSKWFSMLSRCYNESYHVKHPTYSAVSVCNEWLRFSNFKTWVDIQPEREWANCQLDKDLLVKGNKEYSPDTCLFLRRRVNMFVHDNSKKLSGLPTGVTKGTSKINPYIARCKDPLGPSTSDSGHIGVFPCPFQAHEAYLEKKRFYAVALAKEQESSIVAEALLSFDY